MNRATTFFTSQLKSKNPMFETRGCIHREPKISRCIHREEKTRRCTFTSRELWTFFTLPINVDYQNIIKNAENKLASCELVGAQAAAAAGWQSVAAMTMSI